jgi:hypothetical protein
VVYLPTPPDSVYLTQPIPFHILEFCEAPYLSHKVDIPPYTAMLCSLALVALAGSVSGTILWDGRFNDLTSSTDLDNWSWSDEVGPYQYYIVCHLNTLLLYGTD